VHLFLRNLNALLLAICFASVDLLPRLLDGLQDSLVRKLWCCDDGCGLGIEGDII
jgi:hypothetical protein